MTWKSYNAKCLPCDVKYDVIMKLETHTEDEKWLINTRYSRCPPESNNLQSRSQTVRWLRSAFVGPTHSFISSKNFVCTVFACKIICYTVLHRVGRVLSFFSSGRNWDSPNPSPAGECDPPPGSGGRGTLVGERGVGRVPISTRRHTMWYSLYMRTFCCTPRVTLYLSVYHEVVYSRRVVFRLCCLR